MLYLIMTDYIYVLTGIFSILFPLLSYLQVDRQKLLIYNTIGIFFISINFYISGAYTGFIAELLMFIIHLIAILTNDFYRKKIIRFVPIIIFISVFYIYNSMIEENNYIFIVPFAMSCFSYAIFLENIKLNKLVFILGIFLLSTYSFLSGSYYIFISNIIGIFFLIYSYIELSKKILPVVKN